MTSESINFEKWQALGNDFVILNDIENAEHGQLAKQLCHRHYGIGADGLIVIHKSSKADCLMRMFNPDGSEGSACGNGLRCVVKKIGRRCLVETATGLSTGWVEDDLSVATIEVCSQIVNYPGVGFHVNTGTSHLVCFVDSVADIDVDRQGRLLRYHDLLSPLGGANINFVQYKGDDIYLIRTYEKGVEAETLACGTGGAAAAFVIREIKGHNCKMQFVKSGIIDYTIDEQEIRMKGDASFVFSGIYALTNIKEKNREYTR